MSSLFLPQATVGLPEELYGGELFKAHEELPEGLQVGSVLIDKAREAAFVISQATNATIDEKKLVQQTVTMVTDTTDLTGSPAPNKGNRGSYKVSLTATSKNGVASGASRTVAKDEFSGGTLRTLGAIQNIYKIKSNTATTSAGGTFDIMLSTRLITDIASNEDLRLRTLPKTEESNAASADAAPAVGITLCEVPANYYLSLIHI